MRVTAEGPDCPVGCRSAGIGSSYPILGQALLVVALLTSARRSSADPPPGPEAALQALQHPDGARRRAAAAELALRIVSLPTPQRGRFAAPLEVALQREDDPAAAVNLVGALAAAGPAGAEVALRSVLLEAVQPGRERTRSVDPAVLGAAVRAMGGVMESLGLSPTGLGRRAVNEDLAAVVALAGADGEGDPAAALAVRALAVLSAERFAEFTRQADRDERYQVAWFRAAARRGDPRVPTVAARVLARSRPDGAVAAALDAVATMRATELVGAVLTVARDHPVRALRRRAVVALGRLGGGFDPEALAPFLDDPLTAEAALDAARALGAPSLVRHLAPWLTRPLAHDRRAAVDALASIDAPTVVPMLRARTLVEPDAAVRAALWRALAGDEEATVRGPDDDVRWAALAGRVWRGQGLDAESMPERGAEGDAARAMVRAALGAPWEPERLTAGSPGARLAAALAAGVVREERRCDALAAALARDDHETVRVALVHSLARQRCARGWSALRELVRAEAAAPSDASLAAVGALVEAGQPVEAALLVAMSRDDDAVARAVASYALGALGGAGAVGALRVRVATDPSEMVRGAAAMALARRLGPEALGDLALLDRYAWTPGLVDNVARAVLRARSGAEGPSRPRRVVVLEEGASLARWTVRRADGSVAFAVTDARGVGYVELDGAEGVPVLRAEVRRRSIP